MFRMYLLKLKLLGKGKLNVMNVKHYNRSICCHKAMSEALHRLRLQAFSGSLDEEDYANAYTVARDLSSNFPRENFQEKLSLEPFMEIIAQYDAFVVRQSESNPTFSLWSTYLEMVGTLLQFIR